MLRTVVLEDFGVKLLRISLLIVIVRGVISALAFGEFMAGTYAPKSLSPDRLKGVFSLISGNFSAIRTG